jgi:hypothetical protein
MKQITDLPDYSVSLYDLYYFIWQRYYSLYDEEET